jgi:hypothetical protein
VWDKEGSMLPVNDRENDLDVDEEGLWDIVMD